MNKLIAFLFLAAVSGLTVAQLESQSDATGSDIAAVQLDGEQRMDSPERVRGEGEHRGRCRCGPGRRPFGQRGSEDMESRREQRLMGHEARGNGTRPFGPNGDGYMTEVEWIGLRRRCMRIMGHGQMKNGTGSHGPSKDVGENMEAGEGMGTRRDGMHLMGHGPRGNSTSHNREEYMLNGEGMGPRGEGMRPNGHGPRRNGTNPFHSRGNGTKPFHSRGNGTKPFHSRGNGTKPFRLSGEGDMQESEFMALRRRCMKVMGHGRRENGTRFHGPKGESEGNVKLGEGLESRDGMRPVGDWQKGEGRPREDGDIGRPQGGYRGRCRCRSMHGRGGPYRQGRVEGRNPDTQAPQTEDSETTSN